VVLALADEVVLEGWHPEQSMSVIHCCPVIEQREVGPQILLQLVVVVSGKFTVWVGVSLTGIGQDCSPSRVGKFEKKNSVIINAINKKM